MADETLLTLVQETVNTDPDRPSLVVGGEVLTYKSVWEEAARLAGALTKNGRIHRVGVFSQKSRWSYIGQLAALQSGAAFVPLNPTFPTTRTAKMVQVAELDCIIVDAAGSRQINAVCRELNAPPRIFLPESENIEIEGVDIVGAKCVASASLLTEPFDVSGDEIAYIMFTSGSTGDPKGVPVTHSNVCHFLSFAVERYGITNKDRLTQSFDHTFDLSIFDIYLAWSSGACVYSMSRTDLLAPVSFVRKHSLTLWFSVPSLPASLRRAGTLGNEIMPTLRWSLFCGEPLPNSTAATWSIAAPNSVIENLYGPTELTIACFVHRWSAVDSQSDTTVPIGRPFTGLSAICVDPENSELSAVEGELLVNGPQTVPGYWKDFEKTAEKFVTIKDADGQSKRFYKTGDRVRRRSPDGDYEFIGRLDNQIKVLGYRVELGEVEAALMRLENVAQCAAIGWPMVDGVAQRIEAFVVGVDLDGSAVRKKIASTLAPYMVPRRVHVIDSMPLNSNGKVDRKQLEECL